MAASCATLTTLCGGLRNWFDRGRRYFGTFTIQDGVLTGMSGRLKPGQYFRIVGSDFNDGVHQTPSEDCGETGTLTDETFDGAVWAMSVPPDFLLLAGEVEDWRTRYEAAASSPYSMESYGGYTRQKASGRNSNGQSTVITWQTVFAQRMNQYRKL